jgi:hypothetical protein
MTVLLAAASRSMSRVVMIRASGLLLDGLLTPAT